MLAEIAATIQAFYYSANLAKHIDEFYTKWRRLPSKDEVLSMKMEARASAETALSKLPNDITLSADTINVLKNQLASINQSIIDATNEPDTFIAELATWRGHLQRRYCFFIDEMRHYNGGKLPDFILPEWQRRCCDDGKPIYKFPR